MRKILIISFLCFTKAISLFAQPYTFDKNNEGWQIIGDTQTSAANWISTGGNPGGYIQGIDQSVGGVWYFSAPPTFLGNKCTAYAKEMSFDLKTDNPAGTYDQDDIYLQGNGIVIVYDFNYLPKTTWTHFVAKLDENAGWRINTKNGAKATKAQIISVLSNLTVFKIRGEFAKNQDDIGGLDNVIFPSPQLVFDLDRDNSSKALNRDFNSDTICGINTPFRLCDNDLSLNFVDKIDSIVITNNGNTNFIFVNNNSSNSVFTKGNNTTRLTLSSSVLADTAAYKTMLLGSYGISINPPNPPATVTIKVTVYFGTCQYDAICSVFLVNDLRFDLDKDDNSLAFGNDFNSDTLCVNDKNFKICDKDVSLNLKGAIDSIVVHPMIGDFDNYSFSVSTIYPNQTLSGQNSSHLTILDNVANDSINIQQQLQTIVGTLQNGVTPPSLFRILVTVYQGNCSVDAICTVRSLIGGKIGTPTDATLCNYDAPLNLFTLLNDNDITFGKWNPRPMDSDYLLNPQKDKAGKYTYIVDGNERCPSDSVSVYVNIIKIPKSLLPNDTLLCQDSVVVLAVPNIYENYQWQDNSKNAYYTVRTAGLYSVTVSTGKCQASDSIFYNTINCKRCKFYAPNIFSADNNGTNDDFRLYSDCIPISYRLRIYNRWGDLMYDSIDFDAGWDGKFKGVPQVQDVYVYWAEIQSEYKGNIITEYKKGDIMLIR